MLKYVYLLCVKYSTLLLSDVVVVVHSLFLRLKLKREAVVWQKRLIYHNQTSLQQFCEKLNIEYFTYEKLKDKFIYLSIWFNVYE